MRYVKPLRLELFTHLIQTIRKYGGSSPLVYLCMERWDVWERVIGFAPASIAHLDYLIATSLFERFPGLVPGRPDLKRYEQGADA